MNAGAHIFTVLLTGGIASGKTTVSDLFASLGVPVVDTDVIAREVVAPGSPALQRIAQDLGAEFIDASGQLDRRRMRQAIFSDPNLRKRLESILHPLIAERAWRQIQKLCAPYCILVVPLYTGSSAYPGVDRVLVVDASEAAQLERVMARDRIGREEALATLAAQASREQRLALADDVLYNSGSFEELQQHVEALHEKYLNLAASR